MTLNTKLAATAWIGSDTSNADGEWTVETGKEGRFFAKSKANTSCKAATSGRVRSVE